MSRALPFVLLAAFVLATLGGCGSGGSSTAAVAHRSAQLTADAKKTAEATRAAEAKAPQGASPTLRALYRSFPPPETGAMEPSAAQAVAAGEAACRGKSPIAVKEEFYPAAKGNLEPEQAAMIARVKSFEGEERTDRSFVAGQLAADTYGATLPEETAQAGYQGCVYSLVERLKRQLAPKQK